jgi:choline kinase
MTRTVAIILGAGRPFGGRTPAERRKAGLDMNVLEWQAAALRPLGVALELVTGYGAGAYARPGGDLRIHLNRDWETTGAAYSLFCSDLDAERHHLVAYADILFEAHVVEALAQDDTTISIAVDSSRTARRRSSREVVVLDENGALLRFATEAEAVGLRQVDLVGLIRVPAGFMPALRRLRDAQPAALRRGHLGVLLQHLLDHRVPFRLVEAANAWIDLDDRNDLARFLFGSKAQTLARLSQRVTRASIAPQISFTVHDWQLREAAIVQDILGGFRGRSLAVRSSAKDEDSFEASQAGRFRSCLNVTCAERAVIDAVNAVIASYNGALDNQILVQPMIEGVTASGVVLTRTLAHGAPYYVLNYSLGERTDVVTGGGDQTQVAYVHRSLGSIPETPGFLKPVLAATREIETLLDLDTLDIEFAIGADGVVHVLQVRPLAVEHDRSRDDDSQLDEELAAAARLHAALAPPVVPVVGRRAIYGVMPDWNPAEIIGIVPRPLSAALYRYLVMEETWATQRAQFGYRDVRPTPLMRQFAGHAYVDVRASLNSFIPAVLPDALAARLVDAALDRLERNPHLHDKIEFEIIPTCRDFDFARWDDALFAPAGITDAEANLIRDAYGAVTRTAFKVEAEAWSRIRHYEAALNAGVLGPVDQIGRLEGVLSLCREAGVMPFAHLARCAFVAISLLRTAVARGMLSAERVETFMATIRTVSHQLNSDAAAVASGELAFTDFVARYGHLRPGTYEITSLSYADAPDEYLRPLLDMPHGAEPDEAFEWTQDEATALAAALADLELTPDLVAFERFLRGAIIGREHAKFVFTRGLSWALDALAAFGARHGLSRDDVGFLELSDVLGYFAGTVPEAALHHRVEVSRERYERVSAIVLPPLLVDVHGLRGFVVPQVRPNFVGKGRISAPLALIDGDRPTQSLAGTVALIERADPGHDWLFSRQIAGLVTAYGGANSHMAIRCAEFGMPAVIGIGEEQFQRLARARRIELDCLLQRISWS